MLKQKITGSVQEVILPDFPDDEDNTVTTTVTKSRRVSFGPNFVKEFIVDSAISAQCMPHYEQPFPSSDSSSSIASSHGTFVLQDSLKPHKPDPEPPGDNRPKAPKFASTICFSADSPTADMEFTEGCITLAKTILDKKNKEMTVFIQAKPKGAKEEEKTKEDETNYFEGSQFEMSMTHCLKSKEKRFPGEKTKIFGRCDDEMSMTRCERFYREEDEDESKENRMPLDAIMRYLDRDESDSDLFSPEKSFAQLLGVNNSLDMSDESEKLNLNESMDISGDLNGPAGNETSEVPSGGLPKESSDDEAAEHECSEERKAAESDAFRFGEEASSEEMAVEEMMGEETVIYEKVRSEEIVFERLMAQERASEKRRSEEEMAVEKMVLHETVTEKMVSEMMVVEERAAKKTRTEEMVIKEKMVSQKGIPEEMVVERIVTREEIPEKMPFEKTVTEEMVTEKITEEILAEEMPSEKGIAEKMVSQEEIPEKMTFEKSISEETAPEEMIIQKITAEEKITQEKATEKMATEKIIAEKMVAQKEIPEKMPFEKSIAEETAPEEMIIQKITAEEKINREKGTEKMPIEKIIAEKMVAQEEISEKMPSENSISEERATEKTRTEEMIIQKIAAEKVGTEKITEEILSEKIIAEKMVTQKEIPEKMPTEKIITEKLVAQEEISEKMPFEKIITEKLVAPEEISEKMSSERIITEKLVAQEEISEKMPFEKSIPEETAAEKTRTEEMILEEMVTQKTRAEETLAEETITEDLMDVEPPWNLPPFTPKPTPQSIPPQEDDTPTEPSLGDLKVIEGLQEQAKEKGCAWSLRDVLHPRRTSQGSLSFTCTLLDSTTSLRFSLKMSPQDTLDSCSLVTDSSILLDEEHQCRLPEYTLAVGFGFDQLKKHLAGLQGVATLRHVPYYMDRVNSFLSKMNGHLRQIHAILASYPGSRLNGCLLSFRLFSFPMFFSCVVSVDLSDVFRLSRASLSFEHDFGCLDERKIGEIFEESLRGENSLREFVVRSTRYLVEAERRSGYLSKRRHIRLLPDELRW